MREPMGSFYLELCAPDVKKVFCVKGKLGQMAQTQTRTHHHHHRMKRLFN